MFPTIPLAVAFFFAFPQMIMAQSVNSTSTATCESGFEWTFNSRSQSPCEVAAVLAGACAKQPLNIPPDTDTEPPIGPYAAPTAGQANATCTCNYVYYNLISACSACQEGLVYQWTRWISECRNIDNDIYSQENLASLQVEANVPYWAYLNPLLYDEYVFDLDVTITAGGLPETFFSIPSGNTSSSSKTVTGNLDVSTPDNFTPTASKSSSSLSPGAIAGIVIGSVIGFALICVIIYLCVMHYRKTKSQTEVSGSYKELYTDDGGYKFGSDKAQRINRLPSFPKRPSPPKYTSKSTYSQSLNNQHVRGMSLPHREIQAERQGLNRPDIHHAGGWTEIPPQRRDTD